MFVLSSKLIPSSLPPILIPGPQAEVLDPFVVLMTHQYKMGMYGSVKLSISECQHVLNQVTDQSFNEIWFPLYFCDFIKLTSGLVLTACFLFSFYNLQAYLYILNCLLISAYLSPLTLWVRIPLRRGVLDTLCDKVSQWLATGPASSTNKTDCHDITDILLKVTLNTIN
jgi:hypothetical protein